MAIIQISRIQVRRGLLENLPPALASAEFGWALDKRRLFIGNGTTDEGAPLVGNTEILTQYSDIFSLVGGYTFKGKEAGGRIVQTAPTLIDPVVRTMQNKLDDIVNFRDFKGVGDGVTNEVDSFNRAITQLYEAAKLSVDSRIRRTLEIPAGTYILSGDFIRMMPYVKLKGAGKNATFIIQTDPLQPCVVSSCDSYLNTGSLIGSIPGGVSPGFIEAEGITFYNATDNDIIQFDSIVDVLFDRVRMQGSRTNFLTADSGRACINLKSQVAESNDLTFVNCEFLDSNYAFLSEEKSYNVNIRGGTLGRLYRGINLGNTVNTSAPKSFKISYARFENIADYGIYSTDAGSGVSNIVSAYNTFKNVGNTNSTAIIHFSGNNCYSIGDMFGRADEDGRSLVELNGKASFASFTDGRTLLGKQLTNGGQYLAQELSSSTPNSYLGIIGVGVLQNPTILEYALVSSTDRRTGMIKIITNGSVIAYDDEYVETNDMGVTLTPTIGTGSDAGRLILRYTLTGLPVTLTSASRSLLVGPAPIIMFTPPGPPTDVVAV